MTIATYALYLLISIAMTVWVARRLSTNGNAFLVDGLGGKKILALSLNRLLMPGLYLGIVGYVILTVAYGDQPQTILESVAFLGKKIGFFMVVVAVVQFFNIYIISRAGQALPMRMPWAAERNRKPRVAKDDPTERVLEASGL